VVDTVPAFCVAFELMAGLFTLSPINLLLTMKGASVYYLPGVVLVGFVVGLLALVAVTDVSFVSGFCT
jgi:hypothetical protein